MAKLFPKTVLALLFSLLLLLPCFAGCGKTDEGEKTPPVDGAESEVPEENEPKWKEDGILKILAIGNSFGDDTVEHVWRIADSLGVPVTVASLYYGSCTIDMHLDHARKNSAVYEFRTASANTRGTLVTKKNITLRYAVTADAWDFITFQQGSGNGSRYGDAAYYTNLQALLDVVRGLAPNAVFGWNMTWADESTSTRPEIVERGSQLEMYRGIVSVVENTVMKNENIEVLSPAGTAIQNARTSFLGDTLTRDGFHLHLGIGRYIAGLTYFAALSGVDIENVSFVPAGVTERMRLVAVESVKNALLKPYEVTNSIYTTEE